MASEERTSDNRLSMLEKFGDAPYAWDFHVALRRIECWFRDLPRWGEAVRPSNEPIRLGQNPELAFAPSAIAGFTPQTDERPARLAVAFFGLFGPCGALPLHLTEYARERLRHAGDRTFAAFVDIFHHRMLVLFHRAWATAQPTACQDRPSTNRVSVYMASLIGLGLPALRGRDAIPDFAKLQYAALVANPTRHAEGLQAMLGDYFSLPVTIEQFVGEWLELPEYSRSRIGHSPELSTLGRTTILGRRVWRCDHKFRIVLGPLSRDDFLRMLPGSNALTHLTALVRSYVGDTFDWDVRLVLNPAQRMQMVLGGKDRLGFSTRLGDARGRRNEDIIIHPATNRSQRVISAAQET